MDRQRRLDRFPSLARKKAMDQETKKSNFLNAGVRTSSVSEERSPFSLKVHLLDPPFRSEYNGRMSESHPAPDVTLILQQMEAGDPEARDRLFDCIYADLRRIASGLFRGGSANTLQPTALVNEVYLRMVRQGAENWESRRHFFDVASMAMRQLLTDHIRSRKRVKRGGDQERVPMENVASQLIESGAESSERLDLHALDSALTALEKMDPRQAQIVRLRFLTGLSIEETAKLLDISERTIRRDWQMARAWLNRFIQQWMESQEES